MAILIVPKGNQLAVVISGCHGLNQPGHGDFLQLKWLPDNRERANVAARLCLHYLMGRQRVLDGMVQSFEKGWTRDADTKEYIWAGAGVAHIRNGLDAMKHVILHTLNQDPTWKMCPECKQAYEAKEIKFEEILFIVPQASACLDHRKAKAAMEVLDKSMNEWSLSNAPPAKPKRKGKKKQVKQ